MTPPQSLLLHSYDLSISPTPVGRKLTQIVRLLLEAEEMTYLRQGIVSDFKSSLISREKLPQDEMIVHVAYRAEGEDEPKANPTVCKLTEFLTGVHLTAHHDDQSPMIQALNILLKHHSKESGNVATIGASKTFSHSHDETRFDLGSGLHAIRGFFASVRAATGRVLVNVNVSHATFYQAGQWDALMSAFMQSGSPHALQKFPKKILKRHSQIKTIFALASLNDGQAQSLENHCKGNEPGKGSASSTGGAYITVYDFFARRRRELNIATFLDTKPRFSTAYGIQLKRTDLPVVNVGTRKSPTYRPPELNPAQTQGMIQFAVRKPADNARSIVEKGLQVIYQKTPAPVQFGSWNISNIIFNKATKLGLSEAIATFGRALRVVSIDADRPITVQRLLLKDIDDPTLDVKLAGAAKALRLLFFILPETNTLLYNCIKLLSDDQQMANVSLKFNLKLGVPNQLVDDARLSILREDKTMVASLDRLLAQWPAILRIQSEPRREMVSDLEYMLRKTTDIGLRDGLFAADRKRGLPCFMIIIVGKRRHTYFYPTREADSDRSSNPKPGDVVDQGVTEACRTTRPAHYKYSRNLPPTYSSVAGIIEDLIYAMCYTLRRAIKAVSICMPAYYADILCERARCYLSNVFDPSTHSAAASTDSIQVIRASEDDLRIHENLRDTMFYIQEVSNGI
ncbi:ribonuclease H-like domain-containing protein [Dactylonectria macrodidyma]|uniref:Ribonuclease H-like domain-containing protein n=1 Tax=Dactylonectria macrodidyma TaxID=307937 RepID=A0A9P9D7Q8_9HYPO|nr:ribonuclease H-like domain-containing protein [Dactylonectria macrodidyma]